MVNQDDIKKKVKEEEEEAYGEVSGYSEPEDVDESYEEFVGHEPKKGGSISEEVDHAEKSRRGKKKPHK